MIFFSHQVNKLERWIPFVYQKPRVSVIIKNYIFGFLRWFSLSSLLSIIITHWTFNTLHISLFLLFCCIFVVIFCLDLIVNYDTLHLKIDREIVLDKDTDDVRIEISYKLRCDTPIEKQLLFRITYRRLLNPMTLYEFELLINKFAERVKFLVYYNKRKFRYIYCEWNELLVLIFIFVYLSLFNNICNALMLVYIMVLVVIILIKMVYKDFRRRKLAIEYYLLTRFSCDFVMKDELDRLTYDEDDILGQFSKLKSFFLH